LLVNQTSLTDVEAVETFEDVRDGFDEPGEQRSG
jgi:hypothetical protein